MYFKIKCKKKDITYKEKQSIYLKFYDGKKNGRISFLEKFNHALGYKKYLYKEYISAGCYVPSDIPYDDNFKPPYELLHNSMLLDDVYDNDEVITFYIEEGKQYHHLTEEGYDNFDIAYKFLMFLYKVFPDLVITYELTSYKPHYGKLYHALRDVLYAEKGDNYTFDYMMDRPYSFSELKEIERYMDFTELDTFEIYQSYCNCSDCRFSSTPYMVTLNYSYELADAIKKEGAVL